jgi:hypothetical protein
MTLGSLWVLYRSQFSGEEMRRVDVPFKALDLSQDSTMHRLLSYETMLNDVLTGSEEGDAELDHQGVDDVMDICGFPLFSHDLTVQGTQRYCHCLTPHPRKTRWTLKIVLLFMYGCRSLTDWIESRTNGLWIVYIYI